MEVAGVQRLEAAWWFRVKYCLWTSVYSSVRKQWVALLLGHTWIVSGNIKREHSQPRVSGSPIEVHVKREVDRH